MNFSMILLESLETLGSNKMRSGLTVLGIVIGVAAVIAMLAVGNGATASITGSINQVGTNLLFVFRGARNDPNIRNPRPLTMTDANALVDPFAAPHVQAVAPVNQGNATVEYNGETKTTTIAGVTSAYKSVRNVSLLDGEFITDQNILGRASVAVIGVDVADSLFGHRDGLIGETVRLNGQPFRITGILSPQGGSAFGSADNQVIVPLTTAQARLLRRGGASPDEVDIVYIQATDYESVPAASDEVSQILRTRHRTAVGADDFTVFTQESMLTTVPSVTG